MTLAVTEGSYGVIVDRVGFVPGANFRIMIKPFRTGFIGETLAYLKERAESKTDRSQ